MWGINDKSWLGTIMTIKRYMKVDGTVISYKSVKRAKNEQYNRINCPSCSNKCTNIYYNEQSNIRKVIGFMCVECDESFIFKTKLFKATLEDFMGNKIEYKKDPIKMNRNK